MDDKENNPFHSLEEECKYWREAAIKYYHEKLEWQNELDSFLDKSRQIGHELQSTILQNEAKYDEFQSEYATLRVEINTLYDVHEREKIAFEKELKVMKTSIRELEQKNDDLERTNRELSESVSGYESMLNDAYEKNAMLEMEYEEKDALQVTVQRLMDESRDLKQELKVRNIPLPLKDCKEAAAFTSTPSQIKAPNKFVKENKGKLNMMNETTLSNVSLNASMHSVSLSDDNINETNDQSVNESSTSLADLSALPSPQTALNKSIESRKSLEPSQKLSMKFKFLKLFSCFGA